MIEERTTRKRSSEIFDASVMTEANYQQSRWDFINRLIITNKKCTTLTTYLMTSITHVSKINDIGDFNKATFATFILFPMF
jgi:hypothetical protein